MMNKPLTLNECADFAEIYDAYYDRVYKYAYTLLLNREDAEDITSDTFLSAYENYGRYDASKSSVITWLSRIAHNLAVNLLRSSAYSKRAELPQDPYFGDPSPDFSEQAEASMIVVQLYALLKPDERELLNLRCVMELKDREISEFLNLPEKTVNKRYHRLLQKCRLILAEKKES